MNMGRIGNTNGGGQTPTMSNSTFPILHYPMVGLAADSPASTDPERPRHSCSIGPTCDTNRTIFQKTPSDDHYNDFRKSCKAP